MWGTFGTSEYAYKYKEAIESDETNMLSNCSHSRPPANHQQKLGTHISCWKMDVWHQMYREQQHGSRQHLPGVAACGAYPMQSACVKMHMLYGYACHEHLRTKCNNTSSYQVAIYQVATRQQKVCYLEHCSNSERSCVCWPFQRAASAQLKWMCAFPVPLWGWWSAVS